MRVSAYLLALLMLLSLPGGAETFRLASGEWPPYAGEKLPYEGIASRIIRAALAEEGVQVEFVYLSWKRGFEMARRGHLDGAILWTPTPERASDFVFSEPLLYSEVVLLYRQDTPLSGNTAPKGYQFGMPNGYNYAQIPTIAELVRQSGRPAVNIVDDEQGIKALIQERIDVYPIDRTVGQWLLASQGKPAATILTFEPPVQVEPLAVLLYRHSAKSGPLQASLNAGLGKLRSSGKLAAWLKEATSSAR